MKTFIQLSLSFLLGVCFISASKAQNTEYTIVDRFPVAGDGGWDYIAVNENTGDLFVSHAGVTNIVDQSGYLLGTVKDTKGVHGIAIANKENKAFISCGRDTSISIVDLGSFELITKIKSTGVNPDAIIYDPFSHKVFVFNGRSSNATVIDAVTNTVVATIPLIGKPEFSVSDGKGKLFVNLEDTSMISQINTTTLKVENTWSIAPGEKPSGLALDNTTHRLFATCSNKKMVVIDALKGNVITTLDIGDHTDGCVFDPGLKRAYSSNGDGTLTVVQEKTANDFSVLTTVPTQKGARTICINKKTHHLYLPVAEYGETPAATKAVPNPRPPIKPGSFVILDVAPGT
ncbi:MAG: YncE family protein [Saprospiraceae bacterium]